MPNTQIKNCQHHGLTTFVLEGRGSFRCKKCRVFHVSENRRKRKRQLVELFGGKCMLCCYNKCVQALQFHHLNPEDKKFGISGLGYCRSLERAIEEAKKCILLCSNCHFEIENSITEIPIEIIPPNIEIKKEEPKIVPLINPNWRKLPKLDRRKVERPPLDQLLNEIKLLGYSAVGRKYGVSDNAIRKWIKMNYSSVAQLVVAGG